MARSTKPPPPKASGSQKKYSFADPEEPTMLICPVCAGCGLVSPQVAAAINKLLEDASSDGPQAIRSVLPKVATRKR